MSDDRFHAYAETVLELHGVPNGRIDLRQPLGAQGRAALASLGLDRPFAVMTAENRHGEPASRSANAREMAALVDRLADDRIPFVRVDGTAPDGSHREHCVAAVMPRDAAVTLARSFDQVALFWFDGDAFWLLPAEADALSRRLP